MDPLSLFTLALGLPAPWEVVDVAFDPEPGRIDFHRAFASGRRFACPHCGAEHPPVHDTLERDWRYLNFFQFQASIHAKVPPVCDAIPAPGLPPGRGALGVPQQRPTLRMEALLVTLCKAMAVSRVAQLPGVVSTRSPRGADTMASAYFTTSTPSVCSMPAKGKKPGLWPSLPMRSRLMAPVPRTSVERRRTRYIWLKDKPAWSNRQIAQFADLKKRNLKTHRAFRFQETLRELFHSAQSTVQAEPLLDKWYR